MPREFVKSISSNCLTLLLLEAATQVGANKKLGKNLKRKCGEEDIHHELENLQHILGGLECCAYV